jgi:hypothetical protein
MPFGFFFFFFFSGDRISQLDGGISEQVYLEFKGLVFWSDTNIWNLG